jgi:hypothetical protein
MARGLETGVEFLEVFDTRKPFLINQTSHCGLEPLLSHKFCNIKKVMAQKFSIPSFPRGFSGNPAVYLTLKTFKTKLGCWLDTR